MDQKRPPIRLTPYLDRAMFERCPEGVGVLFGDQLDKLHDPGSAGALGDEIGRILRSRQGVCDRDRISTRSHERMIVLCVTYRDDIVA